MDKLIHYLEIIFEDDNFDEDNINEESFSDNSTNKFSLHRNNNDTYNFLLTIFIYFKLFIYSIYDCFISYISTMNHFLYQLQLILILIVFLFSFVVTFEENYNISTDLIKSAYFQKNNLTYITQEMILEKEKKDKNRIKLSDIENNSININNQNLKVFNGNNNNNLNINGNKQDINNNNMNNKNLNNKNLEYNDEKDEYKKFIDQIDEIDDILEINNKNKKYNQITEENGELYFLNFIPIKSSIISSLCFFILYFFIKITLKSKIRGAILLNIIIISILFKFIHDLYQNEYYLASNFLYILLMYVNKNLIDSIYLKFKFKRKDFEIFSRNLNAINFKQFFLKIGILVESTSLSAIISIIFFKYGLNYAVYYLCLLTLISFLGNCFEQYAPYYLKPIKNLIISFIGIINLILSKFILKHYLFEELLDGRKTCLINKSENYCKKEFNNNIDNFKIDCLYLVNDLFTFYCLDYINGFIDYQYRIFLSYINIKNNNSNTINNNNIVYDINLNNYYIVNNNYLWIGLFLITLLIGNLGVYIQEFICFIISLYMTKLIMNTFCKLYNYKISRTINNLIIFKFLLHIPYMSLMDDFYYIHLFSSITNLNENILLFAIKFIFLLELLYYILTTNVILYIDYNLIMFIKEEKTNIYNSKIYNLVYILIEIFIQYLILCLMIIIYKNFENNLILKILYLFFVIIFHLLKLSTLNEIKENNKNEYIIDYNIYIFIWLILSIRLIKLSGPQVSFLYLINHLNIMLIIDYYILNNKKNNNFFKMIMIFLLAIGYYKLNSSIFIIDAIAIVISPIIKVYKSNKDENKLTEIKNKEQKLKDESIRVYNRLTFIFLISILLFYFLQIGYVNIYEFLGKYYKEIIEDISNLFSEIIEKRNFEPNEGLEFYIISKLI